MATSENVLQEADRITGGDRHHDYGSAYKEARRFAQIVGAVTDLDIRPEHYHIIMLCLKLVREYNRHKRDNLVDIAGYARVGEMYWDELDEVEDTQKKIDEAGKPFVSSEPYVFPEMSCDPYLFPVDQGVDLSGSNEETDMPPQSYVDLGQATIDKDAEKQQAQQEVVEAARAWEKLFGGPWYTYESIRLSDAVKALEALDA